MALIRGLLFSKVCGCRPVEVHNFAKQVTKPIKGSYGYSSKQPIQIRDGILFEDRGFLQHLGALLHSDNTQSTDSEISRKLGAARVDSSQL